MGSLPYAILLAMGATGNEGAGSRQAEAGHGTEARGWLLQVGRVGVFSKGALHVVIGILAIMAASGDTDGATPDTAGALNEILDRDFGKVPLLALATGALAYAAWRIVQAVFDTEKLGRGWKAIARRTAYAFSALAYAGLTYVGGSMLLSGDKKDETGDESARTLAGAMMEIPFGNVAVFVLGAALVSVGCMQWWRAIKAEFRQDFKKCGMSEKLIPWATGLGRFGFAADGIMFTVAGGFFIAAGAKSDSSEARGLGGALHWLMELSYGRYLLLLVALGVIAFGIYCAVRAWYKLIGGQA